METLVDKLKEGAKKLAVGTAIGLAAIAYNPKTVEATPIPINSFKDLIGDIGSSASVQNYIDYVAGTADNLMIRDQETGVDSIVEKDGGVWRIGLAKYHEGYLVFGGYANNDNPASNSGYLGWEGWCSGRFYSHVFSEGDTADEVMVVRDTLGDGMGEVENGVWTLGDDDVFYWIRDIEFDGVQGKIDALGAFSYTTGTKFLPHIVINDRAPRTDPAGINELVSLSENWLRQDCHPYYNGDCNGADWNYDRNVNLDDFYHLAENWYPSYVSPVSATSSSPSESPASLESAGVYSTVPGKSGVFYSVKTIKQGDKVISFPKK